MKKMRAGSIGLSLLLVLTSLSIPQPVRAGDEQPIISPFANAVAAPIGTIESSGTMFINGRAAEGSGAVWDGELLQAPNGTLARAVLQGIGEITLTGGALVRLSTAMIIGDDHLRRGVLAASIVSGEIVVKLQPDAGAYLLAGGSAFTAAAGANFRLGVRDGRAVILEDQKIAVRELGNWGIKLPKNETAIASASIPATAPAPILDAAMKASSKAASRAMTGLKTALETKSAQRESLLRSLQLNSGQLNSGANAAAPVRLYANPLAGMIGTVEAAGAMLINGRSARGKEMLWDGELIQAPADLPARITLDGIGQVTLAAASTAKLHTATVRADGQPSRRVLVATVMKGNIVVRLQPDAGAFVEADGSLFAADGGSHFRLAANEGRAVVDLTSGAVQFIGKYAIELTSPILELMHNVALAKVQSTPRKYRLSQVGFGYQTLVPVRESLELRFKLTDENGKAVTGLPLTFSLSRTEGKAVGSFGSGVINSTTYSATTNAEGIVAVPFTAGETAGSVAVIAAGKDLPPTRAAVVTAPSRADDHKFWTKKHAIPVLLTAAAIIGIGTAVAVTREDRLPIKGSGPIVIVP